MNDMNNFFDPNEQQTTSTTSILIYVDGSCLGNPGPGGWSATLRRYECGVETKCLAISGHSAETTNNKMEMVAVIGALKCLCKNELAPITIRSDSQLVVRGMTEWVSGWTAKGWRKADGKTVLNKDLWGEIVRLSEGRIIIWEWVRGHAGDPLNEEVDRLAKAAAERARDNRPGA